ncbi:MULTISPECIES: lasso peptide biosynthesis B2 protein [Rubrivivax]|uniref:Lasso peptide biosynthesis B2 protein n=1 Tax=Rubrivivax benzoatilyticus TaxID=316997 RepID=A0ABX0HZM2_9BURK|nr:MULTISPECIES: lasso peptide biosynthesis B2 protein [Rubrivivax]EGJ12169.1 hypothetical protein RBXJA2T_17646 [Rubrivivax benzoatilyticus JA2 = ATCC BAA-35]MCC9596437.1 lasso peptide biosynthesis B2 protein [Rubrivivax sp. JA1055]MCC9647219.1 lasso peptide biosynthesis B2 protein [Rubrivivax sp. JA1029]NHK99312.1 lasso peptide biosynthesis B2 protein [Rubrivivax benzoatilyticus]NHL25186.1 lasso peptide biosynthesis B2 protein [Rubrivivax benzoatilyticus]
MNSALCLAPHVRACACEGQVILLDLRRSRYLGVPGARFARLAPFVRGWPQATETPQAATLTPSEVEALAAPLLRHGLVTAGAAPPVARQPLPEANESLNADELITAARLAPARALRIASACTSAALRLRWQSLDTIAARLVARRRRPAAERARPGEPAQLREAVAAYLRLRPLLLTAQDRCLHDSLSLAGFLASEGWFPHWVIGVTARPFAAHAWVQSDGLVLSDLHENVRRYTPILVA